MIERYGTFTPRVHPAAWVHDAAVVLGDVEIGEDSSIWPTAVLRGDVGPIRVGQGTSIQDGAVLHDTTAISQTWVGDRVTVGHRAVLHGCRVEDLVLIGIGAIVLDNAVIGTGSVVGAGALVTAGTVVPPGSLVLGSPARVIRSCGDREARMIEEGWRTYVTMTRARLASGS
jgi:carbonic anhydrase/acetyltransferase-like protein (isoleucine patch superfamily)